MDEAILGAYLAGANTRRIRKALSPLLGRAHLSKSTVSRVVGRLKTYFASWSERELSGERYPILYLDGFHLKVRLARRVVSVPVLAVLGVKADGQKVLVALRLAASEAEVHWRGLIDSLVHRGLRSPQLLIADGHKGLAKATEAWPRSQVQRCIQHKWSNLRDHCPVHARDEMRRDWHAIVRADNGNEARAAYSAFVRKWSRLVPAVARSLEEAGLSLLTFYEFPRPMWKTLRTTNPLENLNREFRRRTKTQGSFCTEAAGGRCCGAWSPSARSACAASTAIVTLPRSLAARTSRPPNRYDQPLPRRLRSSNFHDIRGTSTEPLRMKPISGIWRASWW